MTFAVNSTASSFHFREDEATGGDPCPHEEKDGPCLLAADLRWRLEKCLGEGPPPRLVVERG